MRSLTYLLITLSYMSYGMEEIPQDLRNMCTRNAHYRLTALPCYYLSEYFRCAQILSQAHVNKDEKKSCIHQLPLNRTGRKLNWIGEWDIAAQLDSLRSADSQLELHHKLPENAETIAAVNIVLAKRNDTE